MVHYNAMFILHFLCAVIKASLHNFLFTQMFRCNIWEFLFGLDLPERREDRRFVDHGVVPMVYPFQNRPSQNGKCETQSSCKFISSTGANLATTLYVIRLSGFLLLLIFCLHCPLHMTWFVCFSLLTVTDFDCFIEIYTSSGHSPSLEWKSLQIHSKST